MVRTDRWSGKGWVFKLFDFTPPPEPWVSDRAHLWSSCNSIMSLCAQFNCDYFDGSTKSNDTFSHANLNDEQQVTSHRHRITQWLPIIPLECQCVSLLFFCCRLNFISSMMVGGGGGGGSATCCRWVSVTCKHTHAVHVRSPRNDNDSLNTL